MEQKKKKRLNKSFHIVLTNKYTKVDLSRVHDEQKIKERGKEIEERKK